MNYQKFEPYINGKKIGIIKVNWDAYKTKYLTNKFASIVTAISLENYIFKNISDQLFDNKKIITKKNIDKEIKEKFLFVEKTLTKLENNDLKNNIIDFYKKSKNIEKEFNPSNEYSTFYTEEEIENKKRNILTNLNSAIHIIETTSTLKYQEID